MELLMTTGSQTATSVGRYSKEHDLGGFAGGLDATALLLVNVAILMSTGHLQSCAISSTG